MARRVNRSTANPTTGIRRQKRTPLRLAPTPVAGRMVELQPQHQILEVCGFDLMAEIENMLRHVREYQREVQRLRGILGKGQTGTADREPQEAVRVHVKALYVATAALSDTLQQIAEVTAQDLKPEAPQSGR